MFYLWYNNIIMELRHYILNTNRYYAPQRSIANNSEIHRITLETATDIAFLCKKYAAEHTRSIPLTFAFFEQESAFDPKAYNGNYLGSNPARILDRWDVGLCQLNLYWTSRELKLSVEDTNTLALDYTRALPYFFDRIAADIAWAKTKAAGRVHPTHLAIEAYNKGKNGALALLDAKLPFTYAPKILKRATSIAIKLGHKIYW